MHFAINKINEYDSICVSKTVVLIIYINHKADVTLVISWFHSNRSSLYIEKSVVNILCCG